MGWYAAPRYWLGRFVFERGIALMYLVAFIAALKQFRPLLGERGLLPVPRYLRSSPFRRSPSLFHVRYSDRLFVLVAWAGIALAVCEVLALPDRAPLPVSMLVWFASWALYLSIVNVGQTFYGFGWESLLLEAGFIAIFLGTWTVAPPLLVMWLLRWLLFRLEFGAGLIKLRGDPCWRDLTCLRYHHETQPMPGPLSRWFHHLPGPLHRLEVLGNHVAQLGAPVLLFAPQPVAGGAAAVMAITQLWLVASGNFAWLNWTTIVLAVSVLDAAWLRRIVRVAPPAHLAAGPAWFTVLALAFVVIVVVLSWWPARNMASRRQFMNASFNTLRLVNTYGAFGSITRVRNEVVIEGTLDDDPASASWREYEFKGKPGDVTRRPRQIAPYHLRLDWLMWFAALDPAYAEGWFLPLMAKLLEADRATIKLLRRDPFEGTAPRYVRATLYRYRFTSRSERTESGAWWVRSRIGSYVPPVTLRDGALGV